jgi:serine/threonine protein kinase
LLGPIDPTRPHDEPQGGYGLVKAGVNSETGERVCCKLSHLEYEGSEAQRMEIILQAGLKHPNIVDLKDIVFERPAARPKKQICMIMELLTGGELMSEAVDVGGLPEPRARALFRQILLGMAYCHKRKLVHRDIKLENLLLTADKTTVKIADFGLAKNVSQVAAKTVIGTAKYVAPEMLAGAEYDGFKSDMWSCGVCLYCMTECHFPFTKAGNDSVGGHGVHQTTAGNLRLMQNMQKANYTLKTERSSEYRAFLARLLCPNIADRYTAEEALMDPWIVTAEEPASLNRKLLDAMDTSQLVVPTEYTQEQWMGKVKAVMSMKGAAAPEPEMDGEDTDEDAF